MTVPKALPPDLIDSLLANYQKPEDLIGENGLLKQLTKALVERALQAEMTEHLGHDRHEPVLNPAGNTRNGKSRKTLKGDFGELPIEVPRDRHGSFEPQLIAKHQTRWTGFDDKILSLYARGMTVREIQGHLEEMYGTEVSPALISSVTDAVIDEVKAWQSRPLDALYPYQAHGFIENDSFERIKPEKPNQYRQAEFSPTKANKSAQGTDQRASNKSLTIPFARRHLYDALLNCSRRGVSPISPKITSYSTEVSLSL